MDRVATTAVVDSGDWVAVGACAEDAVAVAMEGDVLVAAVAAVAQPVEGMAQAEAAADRSTGSCILLKHCKRTRCRSCLLRSRSTSNSRFPRHCLCKCTMGWP